MPLWGISNPVGGAVPILIERAEEAQPRTQGVLKEIESKEKQGARSRV